MPLWEGTALALAGNNAAALGMRTAAQHFYSDACKVYATYGTATLVAVIVRQHGPVCEARLSPRVPLASSASSSVPKSPSGVSASDTPPSATPKTQQYLPIA